MELLSVRSFKKYFFIVLPLACEILISCGGGIEPAAPEIDQVEEPGIGGTVYFQGAWPQDIKWTLLVLFKDPLLSAADFNIGNFKYISSPIPFGTVEYTFNTVSDSSLFNAIEPGDYAYFAVAQSTIETITLERSAWFISGIYYSGSDTSSPGTITIPENKFVSEINITADFENPPPQPPE